MALGLRAFSRNMEISVPLKRIGARSIILAGWLLTWGFSPAIAQDVLPIVYDFRSQQSDAGWQVARDLAPLSWSEHGLVLDSTGDDPFLIGPAVSLSGGDPLVLRVFLRTEAEGPLQVFYYPEGAEATEAQSLTFTVRRFYWGETCLPLPPLQGRWNFRLDLPPAPGKTEVARIQIEHRDRAGVLRVTPFEKHLEIQIEGVDGEAELVALKPFEPLHDVFRARLIHQQHFDGPTTLRIPRFYMPDAHPVDRVYERFVLRRPLPEPLNFETLGTPRYASDLTPISKSKAPYPSSSSKKGLQVQTLEDALELGIQHAGLNVNLSNLIDIRGKPDSYRWTVEGRTYRFNRAAVDAIPVKALSDAGVVVSLIVLAYESPNREVSRLLLHPNYSREAPNKLGAFHTITREGYEWYQACWEFLADRFSGRSSEHGRVANYIVGNEVTAHWYWANQGDVPANRFIEDYCRAVRVAQTAVRKASSSARVYLSFDHHWNIVYQDQPLRAIAGRALLDGFQRQAAMEGNFEWHLAYHPYPENLFNPRTWEDKTAVSAFSTPRITFKNLHVLEDYLKQPQFLWNGNSRRILLSEQGFHSDNSPDGEALQAAAYAYAWRRVLGLETVDALILHRHVDHRHEGGLNLGLWRRQTDSVATPDSKKPIYEVFKNADTEDWETAFEFALPRIGVDSWSALDAEFESMATSLNRD